MRADRALYRPTAKRHAPAHSESPPLAPPPPLRDGAPLGLWQAPPTQHTPSGASPSQPPRRHAPARSSRGILPAKRRSSGRWTASLSFGIPTARLPALSDSWPIGPLANSLFAHSLVQVASETRIISARVFETLSDPGSVENDICGGSFQNRTAASASAASKSSAN